MEVVNELECWSFIASEKKNEEVVRDSPGDYTGKKLVPEGRNTQSL